MDRKFHLRLTGTALVVALFGFSFGRRSGTELPKSVIPNSASEHSSSSVASRTASDPNRDLIDFGHVRIENIDRLPFAEAYQFIRSAPAEALKTWAADLERLPNGTRKRTAIAGFYRVLAQVDTKAAVDLALRTDNRDARSVATGVIVSIAPPSGFPEVARLVTDARSGKTDLTMFILKWSRFDPTSTGEFVTRNLKEVNSNDVSLLLQNWATNDAAAARAWLEQLDPALRKSDVYAGLVGGWFEADRDGALSYLLENASEKRLSRAIGATASRLFSESEEGARAFVNDLSNIAARDAALDQIAANVTGRIMGGAESSIRADQVTRWLASFPEDVYRSHIGWTLRGWREEDAGGLTSWLSTLAPEARDSMMVSACLAWRFDEIQTSIETGLSITDQTLREKTLRELMTQVQSASDASREGLAEVKLSKRDAAELSRILGQ